MSEPRYVYKFEVIDTKKEESEQTIDARAVHTDGYLTLFFHSDRVDMFGNADFAKVLGPLLVKAFTNKFGGS
jgi:hypothetical protein